MKAQLIQLLNDVLNGKPDAPEVAQRLAKIIAEASPEDLHLGHSAQHWYDTYCQKSQDWREALTEKHTLKGQLSEAQKVIKQFASDRDEDMHNGKSAEYWYTQHTNRLNEVKDLHNLFEEIETERDDLKALVDNLKALRKEGKLNYDHEVSAHENEQNS